MSQSLKEKQIETLDLLIDLLTESGELSDTLITTLNNIRYYILGLHSQK